MILITGITGFVGSNLQKNLLLNGFGVQNLSLRNPNWINEIVHQVHAFIHLAGKAHDLKKVANSEEYYEANFELTKQLFDSFLQSNASIFIFMSTVKAVADVAEGIITEETIPNPKTQYGISKMHAENYILNQPLPEGKRVYILRPCMIHGPGNKGNLNLLFKLVSKNIPWPLKAFENQRSFLSIDNLCFIIHELLNRNDIPSGIYNLADNESLSTNELISLISISQKKSPKTIAVPKKIVMCLARIGDFLHLPLNSERLLKLTESYVVSNEKILNAIGKPLPFSSEEGFNKTFKSFLNAQ
jgi:nucleoside-diphosphate-sugar epimerase